jgi:hypothetical protein
MEVMGSGRNVLALPAQLPACCNTITSNAKTVRARQNSRSLLLVFPRCAAGCTAAMESPRLSCCCQSRLIIPDRTFFF